MGKGAGGRGITETKDGHLFSVGQVEREREREKEERTFT